MNSWVVNFLGLLQSSPEMLRLLARNPFPDRPPKFVHTLAYKYRFTS
jgi:lipase maturation factor